MFITIDKGAIGQRHLGVCVKFAQIPRLTATGHGQLPAVAIVIRRRQKLSQKTTPANEVNRQTAKSKPTNQPSVITMILQQLCAALIKKN